MTLYYPLMTYRHTISLNVSMCKYTICSQCNAHHVTKRITYDKSETVCHHCNTFNEHNFHITCIVYFSYIHIFLNDLINIGADQSWVIHITSSKLTVLIHNSS